MAGLASVRVKQDECLAHGMCEAILPQVFEFPAEDGHARVRAEALSHYLTLQSEIESVASEICPVEAIHLGVHYENAEYSRERWVYDLERLCEVDHPMTALWDPADPSSE